MTTVVISTVLAGCTADERPTARDGPVRPTGLPGVGAQEPWPPPPEQPVGATPYAESTAPVAFTDRAALHDCGAVLDVHTAWPSPPTPNQEADSAVRDCWRSAHEDRTGAEARIVALSIDSGPVFIHLRTTSSGAVEAWLSSKDQFGGRTDAPVVWRHQTCTGVEPRNLVPVDCTDT
jgi:hypothetical protein